MPVITLELIDENQAAEVRRVIKRDIPDALIYAGNQDLMGGTYSHDKHVTIDYHDEQIIDDVLTQHFMPQNKVWRDYVVK